MLTKSALLLATVVCLVEVSNSFLLPFSIPTSNEIMNTMSKYVPEYISKFSCKTSATCVNGRTCLAPKVGVHVLGQPITVSLTSAQVCVCQNGNYGLQLYLFQIFDRVHYCFYLSSHKWAMFVCAQTKQLQHKLVLELRKQGLPKLYNCTW